MYKIELSNRLKAVASFLPPNAFFADIGSDHAYLPCYVCLQDDSARSIAGEVNEGPYQAAVRQVKKHCLENRIEVRKGNGLTVLEPNEVMQITIAGMGGKLITHILEEGKDRLTGVNRIIAQPNVDARVIREWFIRNQYSLVEEVIIEEEGHIYEVLVADIGDPLSPYSNEIDKEVLFGPHLLQKRDQAFIAKWSNEQDKLLKITKQMRHATQPDEEKIQHFLNQINMIEEVINDG